jgi:ligand-binding sensor domain-containing protein/signal transduction histidine kinase
VKIGQSNQLQPIIAFGLLLAWSASCAALDPDSAPSNYVDAAQSAREGLKDTSAGGRDVLVKQLKFTHITTNDGLSQGYVTAILQDRQGFMWFATRDGLNRYDGNSFVVYKNNPGDPASLSSNFLQDLMQDANGYLWIATNTGADKFDPVTERFTRYLHDPNNSNSLGGASVKSIAQDSDGALWFGTEDSGLDKLDPTTGTFTHFRNDGDGSFVGRISQVVADTRRDIWFVGERGLFHLEQRTGRITRRAATRNVPSAESVYEDEAGNLWMLADSPIVGLVKYDRRADRLTNWALANPAAGGLASTMNGGSDNGTLVPDGQNGFWVPSSEGLYYFDRRTERFTLRFQHDETNPDSLDSNAIMSVFRDRSGVLWVGTENAGLNLLNFRQEQFVHYMHRPGDLKSLSPGRVKGIYEDSDGILWAGLFPRALDRLDRKTGRIMHFLPRPGESDNLGEGTNVNSIYRDASGYLWVGGGGSGLVRFDERTGQFKHYHHNSDDPHSLISDNIYTIFADRDGRIWVGQDGGISRFEPGAGRFTNYRPVPDNPGILANTVWVIDQDHSGALWLGTWGGALIRFDEKAGKFVRYTPNSRDPHKLNGGGVNTIHEDRAGTLWVGAMDGLYRFNRQSGTFDRYTETQGLPSSTIRCILEDRTGRIWLSTQKGVSRFDQQQQTFRNYDASDGLQSNEFSTGCYQAPNGEMFFGGTNGLNAFFPENVRDDPYVPPVVITSFRIFNKTVPIGPKSVLTKAIPYASSLTLSYRDNVISFGFAALSYANSHKNRYRYKLENFERSWNEVDSKQSLATYTNLDPRTYVFRVQGSNCDGVWNEDGISLTIVITPPWWSTTWFRVLCAIATLALLGAAYWWRVRQLHHEFEMTLDARVGERTTIARELHDTLLQSFHGLLLRFQIVSELLPGRPVEAKEQLDRSIERAARAITEGRDAVQGLRASTIETNDLAPAVNSLGEELATNPANHGSPVFRVTVEGESRDLQPILRDEIYRVAAEAMRNAFRHAEARQIEVEIRYDDNQFRLRVRDDGKGMDPSVLAAHGRAGHYGLPGMRERAGLMGGKLTIWSQVDSGTEVELSIPASIVYTGSGRHSWLPRMLAGKQR